MKSTLLIIDTPGHVDFSYEVSRSLSACEGVLLLIDATQGIQAQTIANFYLALEADLYILPVINKIDLPSADVEKTKQQIQETLGLDPELAVSVSGKTGIGIDQLMESIIDNIPSPSAGSDQGLRALIFDAYYDAYRGVVEKVRVFDGEITKSDEIKFFHSDESHLVSECGISQLKLLPQDKLRAGMVGYLVTGIKNISDVNLGDTITHANNPAKEALFRYKPVKPMVFSGLFPVNGDEYEELKEAIEKLSLNDPALTFEPETSDALGFGFRVGYLGLLHMEIVMERLEREFNLALITTAPSVRYRVLRKNNAEPVIIDNPSKLPDPGDIEKIEEPYVKINVITPQEYLGNIIQLIQEKRGLDQNMTYLDTHTVQLTYNMPLAEMVFQFYDRLKSISKGYASLDYEMSSYKASDLVKLDILVHQNKVDALSLIVHRSAAEIRGRDIIAQLKEIISKHQFQIALQAAIGTRVIARENVSALRKMSRQSVTVATFQESENCWRSKRLERR